MTARSRLKTFLLCAAVVGALPVAASAGHRHRCCRQQCDPAPTCCAPAPTCCAAPAPACCAAPACESSCGCATAASGSCCGQASVVYSNGQVASSGTVYQYRSGYQGAVGTVSMAPVYQTSQINYGTTTDSYSNAYRPIMGPISANRHSFGKP